MTTKKLAKKLGLLRQRSQSSTGLKNSLVSNQTFSYLIVIDFESTCWREKNNYSQEIIEFPAVLLNTSTGEIESEFHTYVQPQEHPVLSEFCTELTGITQMQVESGIPLQICLSRFNRWLQNLQLNMGVIFPNKQPIPPVPLASQKLCTFLTWSDWDLGVCLQYECKRKQLHKPDVLNSWIDLRSTYRLFYNRKPKGLNGALQDLGIQFAGREHSGLDDARNTARLAARMMRDGCVMKITRSLGRTPSMVKPMFGETTADNKKQKLNADKEENTLTTNKIPPKSCRMKSFSKLFTRDSDTKDNSGQEAAESRQSLVSRKTTLNGTDVLGGRSFTKKAATNISCNMLMRNSLSANNNNNNNNDNSLVLCSTTIGCLANRPQVNQPYRTAATAGLSEGEEGTEVLLAETEDRCASYDDVMLGGDNQVTSETVREFVHNCATDSDSESYNREEADNAHLPGLKVILRDNMREIMSENSLKPQQVIRDQWSATMSRSSKIGSVSVNKIRQHSTISELSTYHAVPKTVTHDSKLNQCKTGQKMLLQTLETSKANAPFPFRRTPFMPEKTSTPNSSFVRPKAIIPQRNETPKSSFSIYTDPAKPSHPSSGGSFRTTRHVLQSLSTTTLSSHTNSSSVSVLVKEGQRITSPLCSCGRRAKRQLVSNGGPNHGRGFYCCPVRRSASGGRALKGCQFFKWESALIKSSSTSSVSLCHVTTSLSCRLPQNSAIRKSY